MKNKLKYCFLTVFIALSTSSCKDWLDVKMSDNVMENTLFSTNDGFLIALNGVYTGLLDVYGKDLSVGAIDIMAQYYNVTPNNDHLYKNYQAFKYAEKEVETTSSGIWTNLYMLIANTNTLLEHCDEVGSALRPAAYPLVKGEALALRAMMHFDLLRLYGPIYSTGTASTPTIPYMNTAERTIQPLLPASEVIDKIIEDLKAAIAILKDGDPVITEGVQNAVMSDDGLDRYDFAYRQLRLNYYAVQALLARAYLWKGEKNEAYKVAKNEIIDKITTGALEVFPWATEATVMDPLKPDRLFSTEVFFAIYNESRTNMYSSTFQSTLNLSSRLTFVGSGIASGDSKVQTFYDNPANDWRAQMWDNVTGAAEGSDDGEDEPTVSISIFSQKYMEPEREAEFDGTETYRYMIPLIRLSEVYLIAAECAPTDEEGFEFLNEVRRHRNCDDVGGEGADRQALITAEFAREVIGEGQLFFHYKRLGLERIASGTSAVGTFEMLLSNYVWPLPKVETDKRGN